MSDQPRPVERLRAAFGGQRKAFIPFLTSGYPDQETFLHLLQACADAGADVIEVGIPFSDPVADGPTIQHSSEVALSHGISLRSTLATLKAEREKRELPPIVLMGYLNPFNKYGLEALVRDAADAGVCGFIVPDLPAEEATEFVGLLREGGLAWVPLLAPTSSDVRAKGILADADAFAYYVSVAGVTGSRTSLPDGWAEPLKRFRQMSATPIVVGFGIGSAETAAEASAESAGIVVGSALVKRIGEATGEPIAAATALMNELTGVL